MNPMQRFFLILIVAAVLIGSCTWMVSRDPEPPENVPTGTVERIEEAVDELDCEQLAVEFDLAHEQGDADVMAYVREAKDRAHCYGG